MGGTWGVSEIPNWAWFLLVAVLIGINYIAEYYVKRSVARIYDLTKSASKAMDKLRIYNQYFLPVLYIVTIVPFIVLISKYFLGLGKIHRMILIICAAFVFMIIVYLGQLLIILKTYKRIRRTTASFGEQVKTMIISFVLVLVPVIAVATISALISGGHFTNQVLKGVVTSAVPPFILVVFNLILPHFYPRLLKATDLQDEQLVLMLNKLFDRAGVRRAKLYQQPTKDRKIANAVVVGLVRPKVIISDYYIENAEPEEIEAVIAHEIGHLTHKHIPKRTAYIGFGLIAVSLTGTVMDWLEVKFGAEINIAFGLFVVLVPFILYMSLGLLKLYRSQERNADIYVLSLGISPQAMITALLKLAQLNHMPTKMKKIDEKFQAHPSIAKRIREIEKYTGFTYHLPAEQEQSDKEISQ